LAWNVKNQKNVHGENVGEVENWLDLQAGE
jgi:hypothetical protein